MVVRILALAADVVSRGSLLDLLARGCITHW